MTALKLFSIAANGTPMGTYQGTDEDAAVLAYAIDLGYSSLDEAAAVLGKTADEFLSDLEVEAVETVAVQSVGWLHEDSYTMIVARISIDDRNYIASEYYDLDEDEICTSADSHMSVCGIEDAQGSGAVRPSNEVHKQILQAMRDFVEVELPIAA
ncbi:hypothetical protein ACTJK5_10855 [Agrobacterium sp. 22094]|uniref:hypothetical protein n=1 Tax=Agrobacterium sp. 22094 TaxID=3453872 RepID=UPI003F87D3BE